MRQAGGQGAECPPETCDREISAHLPGKKRQEKNWKRGIWRRKRRRKIVKGKVEMEKGKRFFLFCFCFCFVLFCFVLFCFVLFCSVLFCSVLFCSVLFCSVLFCSVLFCSVLVWFSLLKTTKICFGSTKMEISTWKKHFTPGKKSGKINLPRQKNFPVTPLITNGIKWESTPTTLGEGEVNIFFLIL